MKFESPAYVAVTSVSPRGRLASSMEAVAPWVPEVRPADPSTVDPPLVVKVTRPVGVPPPGATAATVAVNVTA